MQRERDTYVCDALACLPERLKEVVVGYFLDGGSSADLAAGLGSPCSASPDAHRARKLMRTGLGAQYAEMPPAVVSDTGRTPYRQAAYVAELADRSTYTARLSRVPVARVSLDGLAEVRAAG